MKKQHHVITSGPAPKPEWENALPQRFVFGDGDFLEITDVVVPTENPGTPPRKHRRKGSITGA